MTRRTRQPFPASDQFCKAISKLSHIVSGIRDQLGGAGGMVRSERWNDADTPRAIEIVAELHQLLTTCYREMNAAQKKATRKRLPKPGPGLAVAYCRALTEIQARLSGIRHQHGGIAEMFQHPTWDQSRTFHAADMTRALHSELGKLIAEIDAAEPAEVGS